jgi:hypothetical protein
MDDILHFNSMEGKRHFSHLDLAKTYWAKCVQKDTWAIDATCGNGHDTLMLSQICSGVIALDVQEKALANTRMRLSANANVHFFCQNHESFPKLSYEKPISLIVYNLGYLPGGNMELTTLSSTTLKSLSTALDIIIGGGLISLSCYPGHSEGAREEKDLLAFAKGLDPKIWSVCHHQWINRSNAPSLLLLQKNL